MVLQFTLAACLHKTLLIHVDRLFDVGLCLIEQLACQTHLRAWGVGKGGVNEAPVAVFVWMQSS